MCGVLIGCSGEGSGTASSGGGGAEPRKPDIRAGILSTTIQEDLQFLTEGVFSLPDGSAIVSATSVPMSEKEIAIQKRIDRDVVRLRSLESKTKKRYAGVPQPERLALAYADFVEALVKVVGEGG